MTLLQFILGWLTSGAMGLVSAVTVLSISWLLNRRTSMRLETIFASAGVIGFALMFAGAALGSRPLVAASVLLWGWMMLVILLIPAILLWRLATWCCRRIGA